MVKMWFEHKYFKYTTAIILALIVVFLFGKVDFLLVPFNNLMAVLFLPIALSGLIYYLLRPVVRAIEKLKVPKPIAILIVYIFLIVIVFFIGSYAGNLIVKQVNGLINSIPSFFETAKNIANNIIKDKNLSFIPIDKLEQQLQGITNNALNFLFGNILNGISAVGSIAILLFIVPIIVFYLLKDDELLPKFILRFVPKEYKPNGKDILSDLDTTLSTYILSQALLALSLGVIMYIGYLVIGLKYALVLAFFALITFFIPYLGSLIGVLPAILVGLADNPFMAVKILIIMAIAQVIVGNFLSPILMGKRLNIHPITYIVVLLGAAALFGFIGMLIAVPVYAILKELSKNLYEIYLLRKKSH